MIGVSRYDVTECTGYILRKLRENDFIVRYTHPNLIFISWAHWIPGLCASRIQKTNWFYNRWLRESGG